MKRMLLLVASLVAGNHGPAIGAQPDVPADIDVQVALSQTALWVGNVVHYTVSLTCRPDVDVLQEDLGADKLSLDGLQVLGHTVNRRIGNDGRTHYEVAYALTTFEPGAETLGIRDWTVRYAVGSGTPGGSAPAKDLHIPGAAVAWRSALPAALKTLEIRDSRTVERPPRWWVWTRSAALALIAVSMTAFGWLLVTRVTAGRAARPRRRINHEAARDLQSALSALREADVASPSQRLAAYTTLEAAIRRHAADLTGLPATALTPHELRGRLTAGPASFSGDEMGRILAECQLARYQPVDRVPGADQFRTTLDAAMALFARTR